MIFRNFLGGTMGVLALAAAAQPAHAAGDLLVAPTRVVLDNERGAEVILNNIGDEPATYRISLELKRMTAAGQLDDVATEGANALEAAALEMIQYSPRRVTLPPNQPQTVRIAIRKPDSLPDGEYRAHMLFRAIPDVTPAEARPKSAGGVSIAITPIYGITIPIIVRHGELKATAAIANPKLLRRGAEAALSFDLARSGSGSVYGEIRILAPGEKEPVLLARGLAVYPELGMRNVTMALDPAQLAKFQGPVTIQYLAGGDDEPATLAEYKGVIQ